MNIDVAPHRLCGRIPAIGSKSFAHRALICAALFCKDSAVIDGITPSEDIAATSDCLCALGAKIEKGKKYTVTPIHNVPKSAVLDCRESGSTLRFMLPVAAALGVEASFTGSERLLQRPLAGLIDTLKRGGVSMSGLTVGGRLSAGDHEIDAGVSSQYITGLMLALARAAGDSNIILHGKPVSEDYIEITRCVMRDFGAQTQKTDRGYFVRGGASCDRQSYTVEGDWSNAAFFLVAGALGGDVTLDGLELGSVQGDRRILNVLCDAGANVITNGGSVRVCGGELKAFCVDAGDIPDAVPALCVLASSCRGTSEIRNVERLKGKESDRLTGVLKMLETAGISAVYDGTLKVTGGRPHGGVFDAKNDHRMAMSQTVLALYSDGVSTVTGGECVKKSYPGFFEDINRLGGNCVYVEG